MLKTFFKTHLLRSTITRGIHAKNVTQKLIDAHRIHPTTSKVSPGEIIHLKVDQTLTQDATGTLVMLHLESMELDRVKTELSAQYVDHNILQTDFRNADDHMFLMTSCKKYGVWYSRPGNGVSHPVHMEKFGVPGKTLLGSDSHTCAAGSLGMFAVGVGGLEVALAMAGEPFIVKMPAVFGVKLVGKMNEWVSAKDVILEMLRRHTVVGGKGKVIEYYGPGLEQLTAMDRHVIANMGAELGALTTVFPADEQVRRFLKQQQREDQFVPLLADEGATYDYHDTIDLSKLEPMIALPSSPDNVVTVRDAAGVKVYQCYIGSSANPGLRDFAIPALMLQDETIPNDVSYDVAPTTRQVLNELTKQSLLSSMIRAGARIHQAGCNGCIGMGQAPAMHRPSLRTVPRNFPGRSGTKEDAVYLCSPETSTASALTGKITDPRTLKKEYPKWSEPEVMETDWKMIEPPAPPGEEIEIIKGPNIAPLPTLDPLPNMIRAPVILKIGDNLSIDEIMPTGARVLALRSNIPEISKFSFYNVDEEFYDRAMEQKNKGNGSIIVAGRNYGQGSSREHAALAPRYLGVQAVMAMDIARIHFANLVNFGIVPLIFSNYNDYESIEQGDVLEIKNIRDQLREGGAIHVTNVTKNKVYEMQNVLSKFDVEKVLAGSWTNLLKQRKKSQN